MLSYCLSCFQVVCHQIHKSMICFNPLGFSLSRNNSEWKIWSLKHNVSADECHSYYLSCLTTLTKAPLFNSAAVEVLLLLLIIKISLDMDSGTKKKKKKIYPGRLNKRFTLKNHECYLDQQITWWRLEGTTDEML